MLNLILAIIVGTLAYVLAFSDNDWKDKTAFLIMLLPAIGLGTIIFYFNAPTTTSDGRFTGTVMDEARHYGFERLIATMNAGMFLLLAIFIYFPFRFLGATKRANDSKASILKTYKGYDILNTTPWITVDGKEFTSVAEAESWINKNPKT